MIYKLTRGRKSELEKSSSTIPISLRIPEPLLEKLNQNGSVSQTIRFNLEVASILKKYPSLLKIILEELNDEDLKVLKEFLKLSYN